MPGHRIVKDVFKNHQLYKKYSCLSCGSLLRDAVQSALCGHWFCESCISLLLKTRNPVCPNCSENLKSDEDAEGSPGYFPDKFVRRDIDALEMECVYKSEGCTWEGTFGKLESHLANCEYSVCGTCDQRLTTVPGEHKCTLGGEGGALRCPLIKVGCPAGKFESKQKLKVHMKDSEIAHSELLATSITNLETTVVASKPRQYPKVAADGGAMDSGFGSGGFSAAEPVEKDNVAKKSPPVGSRRSPYGSAAQEGGGFGSQDTGIGTMSAGVPMTSGLQAQMQEDMMVRVRQEMKQEVEVFRRELRNKDEEIGSLRATINKLERNQRSKNADFEDRDFRLSLIENSNYDGTMVWKIPQFSQRMTDAQSGKYTSIFSLPFYTGRYGFKMCLRLYILGDGIGKGSYMSLFFVLMKGEFDNILQWPFTHKVTFKLLNQGNGRDIVDTFQPDPMSTSFRKPKSDMNIASGCPRFVSHEDLKGGGFIVEDTVFIKCVVDSNAIQHP